MAVQAYHQILDVVTKEYRCLSLCNVILHRKEKKLFANERSLGLRDNNKIM